MLFDCTSVLDLTAHYRTTKQYLWTKTLSKELSNLLLMNLWNSVFQRCIYVIMNYLWWAVLNEKESPILLQCVLNLNCTIFLSEVTNFSKWAVLLESDQMTMWCNNFVFVFIAKVCLSLFLLIVRCPMSNEWIGKSNII